MLLGVSTPVLCAPVLAQNQPATPMPSGAASSTPLSAQTAVSLQQSVPGEVLPTLSRPSLIPNSRFEVGTKGWQLTAASTGGAQLKASSLGGPGYAPQPALTLVKTSAQDAVAVLSSPFAVDPATDYVLTGLYQTTTARFGTLCEWRLLEFPTEAAANAATGQGLRITAPAVGGHTGFTSVFNSRPGEWRRRTRNVKTGAGTRFVRLALIMEGPPASIAFDDLYFNLPEPDNRTWNWPAGETSLTREETEKALLARPDSTARIVNRGDQPMVELDGKTRPPFLHLTDIPRPSRGYMKDFAAAGVNLHVVPLFNDTIKHWAGPGQYNLKKVDEVIWSCVQRDPNGYYVIYINVLPYADWHKAHPQDAALTRDGKPATSRHDHLAPPSYYSVEYRRQVMELLQTYVRHIKAQPYGRAVVGFMLSGGEDGQFYYQVVRGQQTVQDGNSPGDLPLFRSWLKRRYGTDGALQAAWNRTDVTLETAKPESPTQRTPAVFPDPKNQAQQTDVLRFLNEEMGQLLVDALGVCKKEMGKPTLGVAYYGRGMAQMVYPHFAENSVIYKSDALDLMSAQASYYGYREAGSESLMPWVFTSARRHNKIPVLELDFRTAQSQYKNLWHDFQVTRFWNSRDLDGATARDLGRMLSVGGGAWWMEMTGGWFHDPGTMKSIERMQNAAQEVLQGPGKFKRNQVALVVDEDNFFRTNEQFYLWNGPHYHSLNIQQRALSRSAVSFDVVYLDDLLKDQRDDYKVYVFLNLYHASDRARKFIDTRLKRNGKLLVWQYAPGYLTDKGFSTDAMRQLTGLQLSAGPAENPAGLASRFAPGNGKLANQLAGPLANQKMGLGLDVPVQRFVVNDPAAQVIGRYMSDGQVSAAVKELPGYTSLFLGPPSALTPQFFQNIARLGGVEPFMEPGDLAIYQRDDLAVIHGIEGGRKTLTLPAPATVTDMLTGRKVAQNSKKVPLDITVGDTLWLRIQR